MPRGAPPSRPLFQGHEAVEDQAVEAVAGRSELPAQVLAAARTVLDLPGVAGEPAPEGRGLADLQAPRREREAADAELQPVWVHERVLVRSAHGDARGR